jgi:glutamate synthase (ferredoxin)
MEMVDFEPLSQEDVQELKQLITNHLEHTQSPLAARILSNWQQNSKDFIKVMPTEYKKALEIIANQNTEVEQELTTA